MKQTIASLCILCLLLSGCGATNTEETASTESSGAIDTITDFAQSDADMFTDRDLRTAFDAGKAFKIQLSGDTATSDSGDVIIDGSAVTITKEGTYVISGTLEDGILTVDAEETAKLQLVFQNVHITNSAGAALYIKEADKVFLTLVNHYSNTLANGGTFAATDDSSIDGALFSRQDLTINGGGSLTVTSPAGHGIVCKDDLVLTGGALTVSAASHGLDANDSIRLKDTVLNITAGKDGLHAENSDDAAKGFVYLHSGTLNITAEGDGISAGAYGQLETGNVTILSGGGSENGTKASSGNYGGFPGGGHPGGRPQRPGGGMPPVTTDTAGSADSTSMKGIKAGTSLLIGGGSYTIDSADDAIHANENIAIHGGSFTIKTGDDGVHGEQYLVITNCEMTISESYEGLEALHIQVDGGNITLTASDDGINAAGGTDGSGNGGRDGQFGGRPGGPFGGGNGNGSITINGGTLQVTASGDSLDANGTLTISGGQTIATGPTQGDTSVLDFDISGTVTGGTFIGTGAMGMSHGFTECTNGVIYAVAGNQPAGTQITLTDKSGNVLISHTPSLDFQLVMLTCPQLVRGETYTLTVGSTTAPITAN